MFFSFCNIFPSDNSYVFRFKVNEYNKCKTANLKFIMDPSKCWFEERSLFFSVSVQREFYEMGISIKFGKHDRFLEDKLNFKSAIFFNCLKKYYKDKTD